MAKDVVGLVISSQAVFGVEISHRRGKPAVLKRVGKIEIPAGVVRDGEVRDGNEITRVLVQLWKEAGFKTKRVICGTGNQRTLVRNHVVPQMPQAQLSKALRYQVESILPVPVADTILDFYPIRPVPDSTPPQMEGLLIAASRQSVEDEVKAVSNAGLQVVGFDLSSFAVVRSIDVGDTLNGTRLVVSLGWRVSHIIVVQDGVPQFVRIVPLGAGHVLDTLHKQGVLAPSTVGSSSEYRRLMDGNTGQNEAVIAAMEPLFAQIRSTCEYFSTHVADIKVSDVLMLGYGVIGEGMTALISNELGMSVLNADPLSAVDTSQVEQSELLEEIAPLLGTPIGLALKGQ